MAIQLRTKEVRSRKTETQTTRLLIMLFLTEILDHCNNLSGYSNIIDGGYYLSLEIT